MDQRIADRRITWIRYFKTLRHISPIFAYHNELIFVYVFVCFVFVIFYDLQVHLHVTGNIDIHSNTSAIDYHCHD